MSPEWLEVGVAGAVLLTVVFAGVFVLSEHLFPTTPVRKRREQSGEWKRRREIRAYLDAIGERYAENHLVADQPVAFYLLDRDVAVTFDALAYFRLEKTSTHAILVEHEMPGAHLGARLPFETPRATSATAVASGPVTAAFATLGLSPGATPEEVRLAYRRRIKEVHPDNGGSEEAFRRVREAYTTAKRQADDAPG